MSVSSISSMKRMFKAGYPLKNISLGTQGEKWTEYILKGIQGNGRKFTVENDVDYIGDANIDHVVQFKNGVFLVLDSKNWKTPMKPYLIRELGKLEQQIKFIKNKHHAQRVYGGLVCYRKKIPNDMRRTQHNMYLLRPNILEKLIGEISDE